MTFPVWPFAAGAVSIAAVLAQYVWPRWAGYHSWQYATALVLAVLLLIGYAWGARKGPEWPAALASAGALVVLVAGLASGLLGPDTVTISRGPGSVAPLPDLGMAAAFPNVDAAAIAAGTAPIQLRTRSSVEVLEPGTRRLSGAFELEAERGRAAFIEAEDRAGHHMTVTQPTGTAFLSPVLTFTESVNIRGKDLPAAAFAVPALQRSVRAVYFPAGDLADTRFHQSLTGKGALMFLVDDDQGKMVNGGIGLAISGGSAVLGDVTLHPSIGWYPRLVVSAVPYPAAVACGIALFAAGIALALRRRDQNSVPLLKAKPSILAEGTTAE